MTPPSLGHQIVDFIETILRHGPGDVQGDPIELDQEFYNVLVLAYQLDPESGRRLIRRYILSRAKGRAKSELAGMVVSAELLGPVRFSHWASKGETSWWGYEYEPGEPVGKPPTYPYIRCLATEEGQAGNTYDNVVFMLSDAKDAGRIGQIDVGLTRVYLPNGGGRVQPSTASNASKDGGKETFAVFDETHLYVLPELRAMHATIRRNLRKRKAAEPWSLETTTMYEAGAESIAETTHRALQAGKLTADVVFDHVEGPDPDSFDWDDDEQMLAALRQAYGPSAAWMDLPGIVSEIRDPETTRSDATRFFLNRASSTESDFVSLSLWDSLPRAPELQDGESVCVGFDGSIDDDSTGIVIVTADGGTHVGGVWERNELRDWTVPRLEVRAKVAEVFSRFNVVRFYGDARYWETDLDEWAGDYGDRVLKLPQSGRRLWEAASRMATLAAGHSEENPQISHDHSEVLRRHIGNARRERLGGRGGQQFWKLAKKAPRRKIDLATAATFAHQARGDAIAAGEMVQENQEPLVAWI